MTDRTWSLGAKLVTNQVYHTARVHTGDALISDEYSVM